MSTLDSQQHWAERRRYELDWLRVVAFALLILYHVGMAYVADWGWHIKSAYQSEALQPLMLWSNQWRMPLLFMISGAAISYQLHRDNGVGFLMASARKLLFPLTFGSLVIVAPQAYVQSKMAGAIPDMTYLSFWRHYLGFPLGFGDALPPVYLRFAGSNVIWNHLWYLPYLFVYIAVIWLMYPLLKLKPVVQVANTVARKMPLAILLIGPVLVFFALGEWLWERFPTTHKLVDDWSNHARYFTVFLLGFALVRTTRLWEAIKALRLVSLLLAAGSFTCVLFYRQGGELGQYLPLLQPVEGTVRGAVWSANSWFWIMAVVGYACAYLARPSRVMQSANRAVYCYYIMHQSLIVLAVYWLHDLQLGPVVELLAVISFTVIGCTLSYRLIKNVPYVRQCFGVFAPRQTQTSSARPFFERAKS
ncbi:acyltransferase [uncultured Gilvimarinus sp.]|uniref:acyltransferase n=1 Tax=uncultured Gilvimarinus sp. TaxID=1689143 RepID=UPI0030ECFB09|tara:strand:- start:1877 stop:3133 length:1257 start_codon:yes stop_codon:yes gene_type:complete